MGPPLVNGGNSRSFSSIWIVVASFNGAAVSERRKSREGTK